MLDIAHCEELKPKQAPLLTRFIHKLKLTFNDFNEDEDGMNTVEAIILLFVAAIVLLVFFTLIWPLIRESVMEQLRNLFGSTGTEGTP